MGKPMARNLLQAGYKLKVHNRSQASCEELAALGAARAQNPREAASGVDVVITMLPDSPDVESVVLGADGVVEGIGKGAVLIDMSSISPTVTQKIAAEISGRGARMLDAPVSGGEVGAINATLAIMVGGEEQTFEECLPILKTMGDNIVRVGDVGSGNYAKLANQIIVALNIAAISEAFVLARKAGLEPDVLYDAIRGGFAGSKLLDLKTPHIMEGDFKPGFKLKLHRKDLKNGLEAAQALNVSLPLSGVMSQIFNALMESGAGESDHSAIVTYYEKLAGAQVRKK